MTEQEKWDALRKTPLSDHEPFCNYGSTNGREMCTCQVLVDITEGDTDEAEDSSLDRSVVPSSEPSRTRSEQRARRLEQRRAAANGPQRHRTASHPRGSR